MSACRRTTKSLEMELARRAADRDDSVANRFMTSVAGDAIIRALQAELQRRSSTESAGEKR